MWFLMFANLALSHTCEPEDVHEIALALATATPETQWGLATLGVAEACTEATALSAAAAAMGQAPPEQALVLDAKSILDDPTRWTSFCATGLDVAKRIIQVAPDEKRRLLWEDCGVVHHEWFTQEEWLAASGPLFLPLMAGHAMEDSDIPDDDVRAVVRAMANIGGPPLIPEVVVVEAGFKNRPTVKWKGKAKKADRKVCKVDITVRKSGELGKIDWDECPEPLRKDVEKALVDAKYKAATEDGEAVKASFRTRFKVK